jgi:hypothetical protein
MSLITEVNSILGLLHRVDIGYVSDVSEEHAASILRVGLCVSVYAWHWFNKNTYTQKLANLYTYTLKNETACTSETMSTSATSTQQTSQERN